MSWDFAETEWKAGENVVVPDSEPTDWELVSFVVSEWTYEGVQKVRAKAAYYTGLWKREIAA